MKIDGVWYLFNRLTGQTQKCADIGISNSDALMRYRMENQRIAISRVGPFVVESKFLGFDHREEGDEPVLFETRITDIHDHNSVEYIFDVRYRTAGDAIDGHKSVRDQLEDLWDEFKHGIWEDILVGEDL